MEVIHKTNNVLLFARFLGNRTHENRNAIIEENLNFISSITRNYVGCGFEYQDCFQFVCVSLITWIDNFRGTPEEMRNKFRFRIEGACKDYFRSRKRFDCERRLKNGGETPVIERLPLHKLAKVAEDDFDQFSEFDNMEMIRYLISPLYQREQTIILKRLSGMKRAEVAKTEGLSKDYVSTLFNTSIRLLQAIHANR